MITFQIKIHEDIEGEEGELRHSAFSLAISTKEAGPITETEARVASAIGEGLNVLLAAVKANMKHLTPEGCKVVVLGGES